MPRFHFKGSGNARAKELVMSRLLTCIVTTIETCELGQEEDMAVGDNFPILPPHRRDSQERRKRPREPSSDFPTESHPRVCSPTPRDSSISPRASEVPWVAPRLKDPSYSIFPSHSGPASGPPEEQSPPK